MAKGIIGKKIGMTQAFTEDGRLLPITLVQAGPCVVVQKKTKEDNGYDSVQLGFGEAKDKKVSGALKKHYESNNIKTPARVLKEFRNFETEASVGDKITVDIFTDDAKVKVTGRSKGKGFQGVIKRHGFHGGPMTHGSRFHRRPGAISACADPAKVFKGTKMPGRKGGQTVSVRNIKVHAVDAENNILALVGAVPGKNNGTVYIEQQ